MAVDDRTMEWFAAIDDHAIIGCGDISAHRRKILNHYIDPVRFLHLQLLCILDNGLAFCEACHDGNDRNLVDQLRNQRALDHTTF